MALLRIIFLISFCFYLFLLKADSTNVYNRQIGTSITKAMEGLFNGNVCNEFFFRIDSIKKGIRLQVSTGYERLSTYGDLYVKYNSVEGLYLRGGLQKELTFKLFKKVRDRRIYFGCNILASYYHQSFYVKPQGQLLNEYYLHKSFKSMSIVLEGELGLVIGRSKNKRLSLECIQRMGFFLLKPEYNYYTARIPGLNYYNMNRLYGTGLSICLFYRW